MEKCFTDLVEEREWDILKDFLAKYRMLYPRVPFTTDFETLVAKKLKKHKDKAMISCINYFMDNNKQQRASSNILQRNFPEVVRRLPSFNSFGFNNTTVDG